MQRSLNVDTVKIFLSHVPFITGGLAESTQGAWASPLGTSCIGQRSLHGDLLWAYRAAGEACQQTTALLLLSAPEGEH